MPFEYPKSTLERLQSDLTERDYIRATVRGLLSALVPEYIQPDHFYSTSFSATPEDLGRTNVDFVEANVSYHKRVSPKDVPYQVLSFWLVC